MTNKKLVEIEIYLHTGILCRVTESEFCRIGLYELSRREPRERGKIPRA